jgi:hypothetical protein
MANRNEIVEDDADLNQQRRSPGGTQRPQGPPPGTNPPPLMRPAVLNPNQQAQTLQQLQQQIQQLQDQQQLTQQRHQAEIDLAVDNLRIAEQD